ncbi:hypothetical protein ACHWQZ_G002260 [Mnemiopsis leidyi]
MVLQHNMMGSCLSSNVHPSEPVIRTATAKIFDKSNFLPPKNSLLSIKSEKDIQNLNVKELKDILSNYCVDYKGCIEKSELQRKVTNLYVERQNNRARISDEECCKICWDATIDCVLLECGHLVCCLFCSKKFKECPICRQYITRVVHTFRG